ncbi:ubiquitin-conjugating enzyme, putative, partial [Plasmodium reichenowi]
EPNRNSGFYKGACKHHI